MTKLIALDDGHGMSTAGKRTPTLPNGKKSIDTGANFMHENEFNRAVVKYLDAHLKRSGFKTLLVAPTDADTSLEARTALANSKKADAYVSVHANANTGTYGSWGGIETFYHPSSSDSKKLALSVQGQLVKGTKLRDRGIKDGSGLWVIRKTNMSAILVECAYMDNKEEALLLNSTAYREECALEIAKGICSHFGVKFVEEAPAKTTPKPSPSKAIYRVRKTWADTASQIGAFEDIESAKDLADKNSGFEVYDASGKVVYTAKPSYMGTVTVIASALNVRKGPGANYSATSQVKKGQSFKAYSSKNGWYNIGTDKWISGEYVTFKKA